MIAIVTGECTLLILQKCDFMFVWYCLVFIQLILKFISIYPASTHSNEQRHHLRTLPSSSIEHQKTGLYQGSADCCEGYRDSGLIRLLQKSQAIHYCNKSVLSIVPDLSIFVFSITIVDLILRSALVRFSLLYASCLYNLAGLRFYIFCS